LLDIFILNKNYKEMIKLVDLIKENDIIAKALEKALFGEENPTTFSKGEEVVVKTTFFPKKEFTGIILAKTSTSYKVQLNDNMRTIKNFSTNNLESTKDKPGFKYKLFKKIQ
jgi:hypothetical protein